MKKDSIDKAEDEVKKAIKNLYKEYKLCIDYKDPSEVEYAKKILGKFVRNCLP